jgi:hypothetical protein
MMRDEERPAEKSPRSSDEQSSPEPERLVTPQEEADQDIAQLDDPPQAEGDRDDVDADGPRGS